MTVYELIAKLVSFDTVSRHSNLALMDFVRDYLDGFGIASTLVPNADGSKANLYATIGPATEGGVVLSGHTDVVPVDGQPWDSDPFTVVERDGKLFGRGTCDMKSFAAIALGLIPEMTALKKPIHLALSYDEEVGCLGAPAMIKRLVAELPRPQAVIVGEPTSMGVVTAHKGISAFRTTVMGREAHSSQTQQGVSAVMNAAHLIHYLSEQAAAYAARPPAEGFVPPYTSIHVGTVQGGTALNIISRHCEFVWDVRNVPGDDPADILADVERYAQEQVLPAMQAVDATTSIRTEALAAAPAFREQTNNPAVTLAQQLGGANSSQRMAFASEAGQFQEAGFATVMCGPGSIEQAHQPNEYISVEQVERGMAFIRTLIQRLSS